MRRKLIGALLSLSLAVSAVSLVGSSVSAQAARQDDAAPTALCNHVFVDVIDTSAEYCEESTSTHHYIFKNVTYKCSFCPQTAVSKEQVGYEEHDLRAAPTPYRFECIQCGYQE